MKSRVFVSCGQRPSEKEIAGTVGKLLQERGFDVYVAVDVQTILEINTGIIRELKNSDCYLFVNFRREQIGEKYRGSLFSNQELAIAYALGFERMLVINQDGILPEGMVAYMGINTETFASFDDCCAAVKRALDRSRWTADYSRRLRAGQLRFSDQLIRYGSLVGRFLYLDIQNQRPDIAALETTAKLAEFAPLGQAMRPCFIRSPLKATGRPGFSHTIFPNSYEAFDLLCVGTYSNPAELNLFVPPVSGALVRAAAMPEQSGVLLNTAYDVDQAQRLPITPGPWQLRYEFFAIDFPVLSVLIELTFADWNELSAKVLAQETT
jgi:hypothetical protein